MKSKFLIVMLFLTLPTVTTFPIEVENKELGDGDQNEGATYSFIKVGSKRLILPFRTHVNGLVHNADNALWAINYHETSDYESADVVLERNSDVYVLSDIWERIAGSVVAKGSEPQLERVHFQVLTIEGLRLRCRLIGQSQGRSVDRSVVLDVCASNLIMSTG